MSVFHDGCDSYNFDIQGRCGGCGLDCSEELEALRDREAEEMKEYYSHFKPGDVEYDLAHGGCGVFVVADTTVPRLEDK